MARNGWMPARNGRALRWPDCLAGDDYYAEVGSRLEGLGLEVIPRAPAMTAIAPGDAGIGGRGAPVPYELRGRAASVLVAHYPGRAMVVWLEHREELQEYPRDLGGLLYVTRWWVRLEACLDEPAMPRRPMGYPGPAGWQEEVVCDPPVFARTDIRRKEDGWWREFRGSRRPYDVEFRHHHNATTGPSQLQIWFTGRHREWAKPPSELAEAVRWMVNPLWPYLAGYFTGRVGVVRPPRLMDDEYAGQGQINEVFERDFPWGLIESKVWRRG